MSPTNAAHTPGPPTLVLIDGEHYPPVVRDTLAELPYRVVGALLIGGTEKIGGDHGGYGVPLLHGEIEAALAATGATHVVDLSDEPVLGPAQRMRLASRVLARGASYEGADFRFTAPRLIDYPLPSVSFGGTGKRIGKTALVTHAARTLGDDLRVVIVAMGRGGPPQPELVTVPPTAADLLARARAGQHAASDYLEHATLAGVRTVGCRRCGGGLAGAPYTSNLAEGAALAAALDPQLVLFDGSGATLPPIRSAQRVLVTRADQPVDLLTGYLNAYRVLTADLLLVTMAASTDSLRHTATAVGELTRAPVVPVTFRPRPTGELTGLRVAFFSTTGGTALAGIVDELEQRHGATIVHASSHLADRPRLSAELARTTADVYLTELKGAAIDVVAAHAAARDIPVVFCGYEPRGVPGWPDPTAELCTLAETALAQDHSADGGPGIRRG